MGTQLFFHDTKFHARSLRGVERRKKFMSRAEWIRSVQALPEVRASPVTLMASLLFCSA